jgi:hypothetical protein
MKKLLVISLIVLLSAFAFAGKLSFSGSVDVTPFVQFELSANSFQAEGAEFGKCFSWSLDGVASSDYGYFYFYFTSDGIEVPNWGGAYIKTPLVEATDVTLVMQGGRFGVYEYAASGGRIYADNFGVGCDDSWDKNPRIYDGDSYDIANMLILDYKDALTIKTVVSAESSPLNIDVDVYTKMLVLDPVYLWLNLHNIGTDHPYLVVMGAIDAGKEAGFPLGFAGKVKVEGLAGNPTVTAWEVGGWFDFSDPLSVYWKLSGAGIATTAFDGVVTVSGIEMLKGDWNFGVDFKFNDGTFTLVDFGFTGAYSHVKDSEISYYPGILVTLPQTSDDPAMISLWCTAEFVFELTGAAE